MDLVASLLAGVGGVFLVAGGVALLTAGLDGPISATHLVGGCLLISGSLLLGLTTVTLRLQSK